MRLISSTNPFHSLDTNNILFVHNIEAWLSHNMLGQDVTSHAQHVSARCLNEITLLRIK